MELMKFTSLESEIEYLIRNLNKNELLSVVKNDNNLQTITINLRRSIILRIIVNQYYPNEKPTSIKLHSFDFSQSSLKPARIQKIADFLQKTTLDLNNDDTTCSTITYLYYKAKLTLADSVKNQDFLLQMLEMIESSPEKYNVYKLDDYESTPSEIEKKTTNESIIEKKSQFKSSEFVYDLIKWDPTIDKSQISIGYFKSEIKFNEFIDDRNHIKYFKVNEKIVWDCDKKIDILTNGEYEKYFKKQPKNQEIVNNGVILKYISNKWLDQDDTHVEPANFINSFKFITYNIMSKNNFKKSINETMKRAKHSAGLDPLIEIDRMHKIIDLFESNRPDFILLQECELYEESKLRENKFIQSNYFICTEETESNCVILSKMKPLWFKTIKLCQNSMKLALVAKYQIKTTSLKKTEDLIIVNIHLTSGKANNFFEKRREQLETLYKYLTDNNFKSDYLMIAGDFNFGDEEGNKAENDLVHKLFISNGFIDLVPNIFTFNPIENYSASITSAKTYPRRFDRLLFKSNDLAKVEIVEKNLVNTLPFEISLEPYHHISFEPYLNIIDSKNDNKFYLNPSDHYGLECSIKFKGSLHQSNLLHESTLAIVLPKHVCETIQQIRAENDPQFERWPPHFNILYPFFPDIDNNLIGEILNSLTHFQPFKCEINEMKIFNKNNVVYLEPCNSSQEKMKSIYKQFKTLFNHSSNLRDTITPHLTISQPIDKRNCPKNWAKQKYEYLKNKYGEINVSFTVDSIHWLTRTKDDPFKVRFSFPLGTRYPTPIIGLNPKDLHSNEKMNIIKFLHENKMLLSEQDEKELKNVHLTIVNEIAKMTNFKLITIGSYSYGIKCNDFDFCLIKPSSESDESFAQDLSFNLAQSSSIFNIVRNIPDANVPIIELCLTENKSHQVNSSDIQIYTLPQVNIVNLYDNFDFMLNIDLHFKEYKKIFPVAGIFFYRNLTFKKIIFINQKIKKAFLKIKISKNTLIITKIFKF